MSDLIGRRSWWSWRTVAWATPWLVLLTALVMGWRIRRESVETIESLQDRVRRMGLPADRSAMVGRQLSVDRDDSVTWQRIADAAAALMAPVDTAQGQVSAESGKDQWKIRERLLEAMAERMGPVLDAIEATGGEASWWPAHAEMGLELQGGDSYPPFQIRRLLGQRFELAARRGELAVALRLIELQRMLADSLGPDRTGRLFQWLDMTGVADDWVADSLQLGQWSVDDLEALDLALQSSTISRESMRMALVDSYLYPPETTRVSVTDGESELAFTERILLSRVIESRQLERLVSDLRTLAADEGVVSEADFGGQQGGGRSYRVDSFLSLPTTGWETFHAMGRRGVLILVARHQFENRSTRAAIAVRKYREVEGRFPATLNEISNADLVAGLELSRLDDGRLVLRRHPASRGLAFDGELRGGDILLGQ